MKSSHCARRGNRPRAPGGGANPTDPPQGGKRRAVRACEGVARRVTLAALAEGPGAAQPAADRASSERGVALPRQVLPDGGSLEALVEQQAAKRDPLGVDLREQGVQHPDRLVPRQKKGSATVTRKPSSTT